MSAQERILAWSIPEPNTGCWLWLGTLFGKGYARCHWTGLGTCAAHRVSYEAFVGPIPDGLTIDHLCRVKCCVNPQHLEPVTNRENFFRSNNPIALQIHKTHCKHGHPLFGRNLYPRGKGWRACKACANAAQKAYQARKKLASTQCEISP